jgi:hypothetical protein
LDGKLQTRNEHRPTPWWIGSAFFIAALALAFIAIDIRIIEIGASGLSIPVKNGDVMTHTFIHSMYDVPVIERFRIENDGMHLFHVDSESGAALEYYGIENRHENNVSRRIQEFSIPVDSIGSHVLSIGNRHIFLSDLNEGGHSIRIRLTRLPAIVNGVNFLWR